MEQVNVNFFKKAKRAIFSFDEYGNFATEKFKSSMKYLLTLILVLTIIITIISTYIIHKRGASNLLEKLTQNMTQEEREMVNIGELSQSVEQIEDKWEYLLWVAIITFIIMYIALFISIIFDIFVLTILGLILNKLLGTNFKFSNLFRISIYAMTLPVILLTIYMAVNLLFGFTIKYFGYAYDAISYIYLIAALMTIRADIIKNMQEVQKVVEIQKQVKEELKQERKEREEQKRREKEKQKEKKEKEKEEEGSGDPQGDNA